MRSINIAVLGATGVVGQMMLSILAERAFPVGCLYPLASARSAGTEVLFKGVSHQVHDAATFDFSQVQLALFSAGREVAAIYAPKAVRAGCVVVDNSSAFRYQAAVPLVVPEVNPEALLRHTGIIANPNCSTIQMVMALKPIQDAVGWRRLNIATYQAVSGAGHAAMTALREDSLAALGGGVVPASAAFAKTMAFNVLPQIDAMEDNGYTREEMKMVWETRKILGDSSIQINPTAVRVPVFHGHAVAIHGETCKKITAQHACKLLASAPGLCLMADGIPTPREAGEGQDQVFVGRVREALDCLYGLNLWVVADNLRKGAALNAVQIAEQLFVFGGK